MNRMGICGDRCESCPRFLATQRGGRVELETVKQLWVRLGLRAPDFPVAEMACRGCRTENRCAYPELRDCLQSKAHANCGVCDEYPCARIHAVFEKSEKLKGHAEKVCSPAEMERLQKAFFSKKSALDRIHRQHRTRKHPARTGAAGESAGRRWLVSAM